MTIAVPAETSEKPIEGTESEVGRNPTPPAIHRLAHEMAATDRRVQPFWRASQVFFQGFAPVGGLDAELHPFRDVCDRNVGLSRHLLDQGKACFPDHRFVGAEPKELAPPGIGDSIDGDAGTS